MELAVYFVLPMVGSLFIMGSLLYGMYQMSGREEGAPGVKWWAAVLYTILAVLLSMLGSGLLNLAVTVFMAFFCRRLFSAPRSNLIYYLLLTAAFYVTDGAVSAGYSILLYRGVIWFNSQELSYAALVVALRLIEFMVIRLGVFLVRRRTGLTISLRQFLTSMILPAFSIFNMYVMAFLLQIYQTPEMFLLFAADLTILTGINLFYMVLMDAVSEKNRLENERNLYRQQAWIQTCYYEKEEEKYEESRKLIHDIRSHIQAMEELYRRDSARDASEYAGRIHEILNGLGQKYYTSHKLLNIILNDKSGSMQRQGIREDIKIGDVKLDFMRDVDVTTLFSNLLDNGIAAAAESREPALKLRVNPVRGFVSVTMENSCDREPVRTREGFRSGKKDHEGLGLKNMRRTVESYGGDMQCEWKDGRFYTRFMFAAAELSDLTQ